MLDRRAAVEPPSYGPDRVMARIGGRNPARTQPVVEMGPVGCATAVLIASVLWIAASNTAAERVGPGVLAFAD